MIRLLRIVSIVEATSYLLLVVATIVKYTADNERGVTAIGPVHGVLFLVYAALVVINANDLRWNWQRVVAALFLGSIPFGGFWVERTWLRDAELASN